MVPSDYGQLWPTVRCRSRPSAGPWEPDGWSAYMSNATRRGSEGGLCGSGIAFAGRARLSDLHGVCVGGSL